MKKTKKKNRKNYKGFVLEFEERVKRGFPIDMTTMRELARKYRTPILMILACMFVNCSTDEVGARKVLEENGYTDIQWTGYQFFICGNDDWYSTGFKAKNIASGQTVEGCVCKGITKGSTIRFK